MLKCWRFEEKAKFPVEKFSKLCLLVLKLIIIKLQLKGGTSFSEFFCGSHKNVFWKKKVDGKFLKEDDLPGGQKTTSAYFFSFYLWRCWKQFLKKLFFRRKKFFGLPFSICQVIQTSASIVQKSILFFNLYCAIHMFLPLKPMRCYFPLGEKNEFFFSDYCVCRPQETIH